MKRKILALLLCAVFSMQTVAVFADGFDPEKAFEEYYEYDDSQVNFSYKHYYIVSKSADENSKALFSEGTQLTDFEHNSIEVMDKGIIVGKLIDGNYCYTLLDDETYTVILPETYQNINNYEVLGYICDKAAKKEYFSIKSPIEGNEKKYADSETDKVYHYPDALSFYSAFATEQETIKTTPIKGLDGAYIYSVPGSTEVGLVDENGNNLTNYRFRDIDDSLNEAGLLKVRLAIGMADSTTCYLDKDLKALTLYDRIYGESELLNINGKYYLRMNNANTGDNEYYDTDGNKLDKPPTEQITPTETTTEMTTTASVNTNDLPSYWAQSEVTEAVDFGIVSEKFQSDYTKPITRENFCELIINTLRVQNADILKCADTEGMNFTDTNNSDIKLASALGIVAGVGNNKFNPDGNITRQEAARMLYRAATISERFPETEEFFDPGFIYNNKKINSPYQFDDISKFEYWSSLGIQYCYQNDIMFGVGHNNFDPTGSYTREQAYLTALRLYKNYNGDVRFFDAEYNYNTHKFIYCDEEFDKVYTINENKIIVFNNSKYSLVDYSGNYFIDDISKNIELLNRSDISVYDCSGDWLIISEPLYSRSDGSIYDYRSSLCKADGTYLWTMPNLHFTDSGDVISVDEADTSYEDNVKKAHYTLLEREKYGRDEYSAKQILVYKK